MGGAQSFVAGGFRRRSAGTSNGQGPGVSGQYRYTASSSESYFSSHFYLGHRKFETGDPELFLFGDLQDLNYLPAKPVKFPYKQPSKSQPLKTLRSFVNVQRDSIKLVKIEGSSDKYRISFTFDSDIACKFSILTQIVDTAEVKSLIGERGPEEPVFKYGAGCEQQFNETDYTLSPGQLLGEGYDPAAGRHTIPLALLMETDQHDDAPVESQQALLSLCTMDHFGEDNFSIKIIKQKLLVGGMELLLQELYGLENKLKPKEEGEGEGEEKEEGDSDSEVDGVEELGAECVICITEVRDTLLLPCRHLCLCSSCAANLRFQASNCPICRAPFRALLQIRALEALPPHITLDDDTITGNPKYAVPGYRCVPLLQALNGYQLEKEGEEEEREGRDTTVDPDVDGEGKKEERENKEESHEEGSLHLQPSSLSGYNSAEATTEFCVIHIEDGPTDVVSGSSPTADPIRTIVKPSKSSAEGVVGVVASGEAVIPLPGTPDPPSSAPSEPPSPAPSASGQDQSDLSVCDPQASSWCSSSVGSEISVKSTEALIAKTT